MNLMTFCAFAILLNIIIVLIDRRIEKETSVPNYVPDDGVDDNSLRAVPLLLEEAGVLATSPLNLDAQLPLDIYRFFQNYEKLRIEALRA